MRQVHNPNTETLKQIQLAKVAIENCAYSVQNHKDYHVDDIVHMHKGLIITLDNILTAHKNYDLLCAAINDLGQHKKQNTDPVYMDHYSNFLHKLKHALDYTTHSGDLKYLQTKYLPLIKNPEGLTIEFMSQSIYEISLIEVHKTKNVNKLPWYKRWFTSSKKAPTPTTENVAMDYSTR